MFKDTTLVNTNWINNNRLLDYDVQTKIATRNSILYGGVGISFRQRKDTTTSLYENFGISFIKYYTPSIYFKNGGENSLSIKKGDHIYIRQSDPSSTYNYGDAIVTADPIIVSGSWAAGTAQGRIPLSDIDKGSYSFNSPNQ